MKKTKKSVKITTPKKSGLCATCFYKFRDRFSETGFYCIDLHKEVSPDGGC